MSCSVAVTPTLTLTLGTRLRLAREAAGLYQADVAHRLRVTRATVNKWEGDHTRPAWATRERLAEIYDVGVQMFEDGEMTFAALAPADLTGGLTGR